MRVLLYVLLMITLLDARDNPFFPAESDFEQLQESESATIPSLSNAAVILPGDAAVVKEVTVRFQKADGSVDTRTIMLEHRIDPQLPLFVTQSYTLQEKPAPITKSVAKKSPAPMVAQEEATPVIEPEESVAFTEVIQVPKVSFLENSNDQIKIVTADPLIKRFTIYKPQRLVLDFERKNDFGTYNEKLLGDTFASLTVGSHDDYYRVVIELQKRKKCNVAQEDGELIVTCK